MEFLTIYILCYNRPDYARQSIQSVLNQTNQSFKLIVSDQSSNDAVTLMMKEEFPNVDYIRRPSTVKHLEHFNLCIEEARSDYYCLFHDDDIMYPNFVEVMHKLLLDYPTAAAYGCNAKVERCGKLEPRLFFRSFRKHELIDSPRNMAERYFSRAQSGIAPCPCYIYNRRLVGDSKFLVDGGKYADVALPLDILQKGFIVWLNEPLMTYRIHHNNVSNSESLRDRLRFLGYLKKNRLILGKNLLKDYRCSFIYKKIVKSNKTISPKRLRVATSFLNNYRWTLYTRPSHYKALVIRALVKWKAER